MRTLAAALLILTLLVHSRDADAQYMYLDSNGDGVNDSSDVLSTVGTTQVDIWLQTNMNGSGNPASCPTGSALTMNSYEFILRAAGGEIGWGDFTNLQASTMSLPFGVAQSPTEYRTGFGGGTVLPPGAYKLGTLTVSVLSGAPALEIVGSSSLAGTHITAFGSSCPGVDEDNTLKLGSDWQDTAGLGAGPPMSLVLTMEGEGLTQGETVTASCIPGSQFTCTWSARPSVFNAPEAHNRCCKRYESPETYGCILTLICNGHPAQNTLIHVEVRPKQLTGGHCHTNEPRPNATPALFDGTTDSQGRLQFVLTMPEVAGVLEMIPYSTDADCPVNPGRAVLAQICVKEQGLVPLSGGDGYFIYAGGPDNVSRHPDFHYGLTQTNEAIKRIARDLKESVPPASDLAINDMSLEWGGRFDIITDASGARTSTCGNPPKTYNLPDDWRAPHCGHRQGMTVDISPSNQPDRARKALKMYFRAGRHIPLKEWYGPSLGHFSPAFHGNHWHMDFSF